MFANLSILLATWLLATKALIFALVSLIPWFLAEIWSHGVFGQAPSAAKTFGHEGLRTFSPAICFICSSRSSSSVSSSWLSSSSRPSVDPWACLRLIVKFVNFAIHHCLHISCFKIRAMVFNKIIWMKHIGSYLATKVDTLL